MGQLAEAAQVQLPAAWRPQQVAPVAGGRSARRPARTPRLQRPIRGQLLGPAQSPVRSAHGDSDCNGAADAAARRGGQPARHVHARGFVVHATRRVATQVF